MIEFKMSSGKTDITVEFTTKTEKHKGFTGKEGETLWKDEKTILAGLGEKPTGETYRRTAGIALNTIRKKEPRSATFNNVGEYPKEAAEGILLALYSFDKYKEKKNNTLTTIHMPETKNLNIEELQKIFEAVNYSREIANENSNIVTPPFLVKEARRIAKETGLKCTILGKKELEEEKLGLILGVGQGGEHEPALIIMEHGSEKDGAPIAIIGKGVCFDTGGLNIKVQQMQDMRFDMCGAATVLALMKLSAEKKIHSHIIGVIPAVENFVDAKSYRPGDVYTACNGVTVEIANTDAEGRLILGDAIAYTVKTFKPEKIITIATLTGAVLAALGDYIAGMVSTDDKTAKEIKIAGETTGEYVWQLPINNDYIDEMKGDRSTCKNLGYADGKYAGTITGAAFLTFFTDKTPLTHIDTAGLSWMTKPRWYYEKGATGFGVRLLWEWIRRRKA